MYEIPNVIDVFFLVSMKFTVIEFKREKETVELRKHCLHSKRAKIYAALRETIERTEHRSTERRTCSIEYPDLTWIYSRNDQIRR